MTHYKQESNKYANALHQAQINIRQAKKVLKRHEYETLSREDAIAFRALEEIERKLDTLEENAWFLKSSSR